MWGIFETNFKEIYFQIEQQKKKVWISLGKLNMKC